MKINEYLQKRLGRMGPIHPDKKETATGRAMLKFAHERGWRFEDCPCDDCRNKPHPVQPGSLPDPG